MDRFMKKVLGKAYGTMKHPCQIRPLRECDLPAVLEIERLSFQKGWNEKCFRSELSGNSYGEVAERDQQVVGFIMYRARPSKIIILNLAVHPGHRRQDVGSQMIQYLITHRLSPWPRRAILLGVQETFVGAQLFFRSQGFYWIHTLKNRLKETDEDVYLMQYVHSYPSETFVTRNRVSSYFMED